jgi:hypothetical protein
VQSGGTYCKFTAFPSVGNKAGLLHSTITKHALAIIAASPFARLLLPLAHFATALVQPAQNEPSITVGQLAGPWHRPLFPASAKQLAAAATGASTLCRDPQ